MAKRKQLWGCLVAQAKKKPAHRAYFPVEYGDKEIRAMQALNAGTATSEQQQHALRWIIESACATYDWQYRPESQRDTDMALGRSFVGHQIIKLTKILPTSFSNPQKE